MGARIVKQPNGKFARFSDVVDGFTAFNLTADEAESECIANGMSVTDAKAAVNRGADDLSNDMRPFGSNGLGRWNEALSIIEQVHGNAELVRILSEINETSDLSRSTDPSIQESNIRKELSPAANYSRFEKSLKDQMVDIPSERACCVWLQKKRTQTRSQISALYELGVNTPRLAALHGETLVQRHKGLLPDILGNRRCPCHETPDPDAFAALFAAVTSGETNADRIDTFNSYLDARMTTPREETL